MAGSDPDFDPDEFRADIVATMTMGLPVDVALRPTFFFDTDREYADTDSAGQPWDWTAAPTDDPPPAGVQVPCAVEPREGETDETTLGVFDADEYVLTFLDEQWAIVQNFTYCTLHGRRFKRSKIIVTPGLHDTTIFQIRVEAEDI